MVGNGAGNYLLDQQTMGTRYVTVLIRTLMNPDDPDDVKLANAAQDGIQVQQDAVGTFEVPDWNSKDQDAIRTALIELVAFVLNTDGRFGNADQIEPIAHMIGSTAGWGGPPPHPKRRSTCPITRQ